MNFGAILPLVMESHMAVERTLSIIKPDATKRNLTGKIVAKFEDAGLRVVASKRIHLSTAQAGAFYAEHAARGFYGELCEFMASEPVVVQVLEGECAIAKEPRSDGGNQPGECRCWHHPQGICFVGWRKLGPRVGQRSFGGARDFVLLLGP